MSSILFYIAKGPTPAYNTPLFPSFYKKRVLPIDEQGLFRPLEFVARKGTLFKKIEAIDRNIWKVETDDYPNPVFINSIFLTKASEQPLKRKEAIPSHEEMLNRLDGYAERKIAYVWGGNQSAGIPEMLKLYPPKQPLDIKMKQIWTLEGLDCSGLIYEMANGTIPRNSSDQILLGDPVPIKGKTAEEIVICLLPLDIIGWKGHVLIKGRKNLVESRAGFGVITTDPIIRLNEIMKTRAPSDIYLSPNDFVVRRWHAVSP